MGGETLLDFELHARDTLEKRGLKDAWALPQSEIIFKYYRDYYVGLTLSYLNKHPEKLGSFFNGINPTGLYGEEL